MKTISRLAIIVLGAAGLAGCASHSQPAASAPVTVPAAAVATNAPAGTNVLADVKERTSYAIGMSIGRSFEAQSVDADPDMVTRGIRDTLAGKALLTPAEMQQTLGELQRSLMAKAQKMREAAGQSNLIIGEAFFATNKNNPGVVSLASGLQYEVITNGTGATPESNDVLQVTYKGTLLDGTVFDDSLGRPRQFTLGAVIPGWTEALQHMNVGSRWKLFVPSKLAYGEMGRPPRIMPNSALIFDMELVSAEHPKPPEPLTSDIVKVPSLEEMKKGAKIEVIKPEDAAKAAQAAATNSPPK